MKSGLKELNLENQYFTNNDYLAFKPSRWEDDSKEAVKERSKTADKLLDLHDQIYPKFKELKMINLNPHFNKKNITSSTTHSEGYTSKRLSSVWLHYGKSEKQIKSYEKYYYGSKPIYQDNHDNLMSFINHIRLQVIVGMEQSDKEYRLGTWLVLGKDNNGGIIDRGYFKQKLVEQTNQNVFFELCKSLPEGFWMNIGEEAKDIHKDLDTSSQLIGFAKKDRPSVYFIIGRTYLESVPILVEN